MALRGHVFDKQLFSSDCYALVTDTFLGKQSGIIRGCDMTHTTSLIHINEGYFVVKGRPIQEEGGSNIEVEPGNIDGSYCKFVCELDMSKNNTTTELNQVSYKIVEDATNYPVLTQEDITNNGTIYQFELAKFRRTLNGIEDFVDTRSFLNFDSIYEEVRNEIKKIEEGSIFVTEEELSEKGVIVSPTEPTTNEKVWIQKGKNLFNPNTMPLFKGLWGDGTTNKIVALSNGSGVIVPIQGGNTITISKGNNTGIYCGTTSNYPATGVSFIDNWSGTEPLDKLTITTSKNAKYLFIGLYDTTKLMVEYNSTATEYEAYIDKAIHVKNDNGSYEEFYNEEKIKNNINSNELDVAWKTTHKVSYSDIRVPKLVFLHWANSIRIYVIYLDKVILVGENGSDTVNVTIDNTNKIVTFALSNTGIMYTSEFPTNPTL